MQEIFMRVYVASMLLAAAIKKAIQPQRGTQKQIAARFGISQGHLSKILSGRFKTANAAVKKICKNAKIELAKFSVAAPASDSRARNAEFLLSALSSLPGEQRVVIERVLAALVELTVPSALPK